MAKTAKKTTRKTAKLVTKKAAPKKPVMKPWAHLLEDRPVIAPGYWITCGGSAKLSVDSGSREDVQLSIDGQYFTAEDLDQLAEFCTELAAAMRK